MPVGGNGMMLLWYSFLETVDVSLKLPQPLLAVRGEMVWRQWWRVGGFVGAVAQGEEECGMGAPVGGWYWVGGAFLGVLVWHWHCIYVLRTTVSVSCGDWWGEGVLDLDNLWSRNNNICIPLTRYICYLRIFFRQCWTSIVRTKNQQFGLHSERFNFIWAQQRPNIHW